MLPAAEDRVCLPLHRATKPPGHASQDGVDGLGGGDNAAGGKLHRLRYCDTDGLSEHLPRRDSLLRKLQELLRGKLALGLDLAKSSNDGLKHLVTAAHGRHRVTNGLDHIKHSAGGKAVSQELPGSLLQPDEPEGGPAGVDLKLS